MASSTLGRPSKASKKELETLSFDRIERSKQLANLRQKRRRALAQQNHEDLRQLKEEQLRGRVVSSQLPIDKLQLLQLDVGRSSSNYASSLRVTADQDIPDSREVNAEKGDLESLSQLAGAEQDVFASLGSYTRPRPLASTTPHAPDAYISVRYYKLIPKIRVNICRTTILFILTMSSMSLLRKITLLIAIHSRLARQLQIGQIPDLVSPIPSLTSKTLLQGSLLPKQAIKMAILHLQLVHRALTTLMYLSSPSI